MPSYNLGNTNVVRFNGNSNVTSVRLNGTVIWNQPTLITVGYRPAAAGQCLEHSQTGLALRTVWNGMNLVGSISNLRPPNLTANGQGTLRDCYYMELNGISQIWLRIQSYSAAPFTTMKLNGHTFYRSQGTVQTNSYANGEYRVAWGMNSQSIPSKAALFPSVGGQIQVSFT